MLSFFIFTSNFYAQKIINYDEQMNFSAKLFQACPPLKSERAAVISTTIWWVEGKSYKDSLIVEVFAVMDCDKSWIKSEFKENSQVLRHEELHFKITELYARKLRMLLEEGLFRYFDYKKYIQGAYTNIITQWRLCQKQYDDETNHGQNTNAQMRWETYVQKELDNLHQFSNFDVTLNIIQFE